MAQGTYVLARLDRLKTRTFGALVRNRNFRLYWFGALGSNLGTWIQMTAQGWLVFQLTGSELYLGIVGFATAAPSLALSLFGGVLADGVERRRLMLFTQTGSMLLAFTLALLTLTGLVTVWHIIAIAFLSGVVNALNAPVRMGIISDLVVRDDLQNAVALNSAQFQSSRMIGPSIAGVIIALVGPAWCFLINGLSFLAVIGSLLMLELPPFIRSAARRSVFGDMVEGLRYAWAEPTIRSLVLLAMIPSLFAMPYQQMLPAFASEVLGVGAAGLGLLMSAAGAGALIGALTVASLGKSVPRGKLLIGAVASFGSCLVIFSATGSLPVSAFLLVLVGISSMTYNSLMQTALQMRAADHMRGRVMSLLTLASFGMSPLGQLAMGATAETTGISFAVLAGGAITVLFGIGVSMRSPQVRRLV